MFALSSCKEAGLEETLQSCWGQALAGVGLALRATDPAAYHYRHLATVVARALRRGRPLEACCLTALFGKSPAPFLILKIGHGRFSGIVSSPPEPQSNS